MLFPSRPMRRATFLALLLACIALPGWAQTREQDVVYGKHQGVTLMMDVFRPAKPNGIGLMWMVSGSWISKRENISPEIAKPFTDKGITVFEVVHRSATEVTLAEITSDIARAIRFVRTNATRWQVDPNRLGISGGSSGGHLSLYAAAYGGPGDAKSDDPVERASSRVQAVACLFPPTDFLNYGREGAVAMSNPFLKRYWPAFGITDKTPPETALKVQRAFSPIYGDLAHFPPTLIIHGNADMLVPLQQSERMMEALHKFSPVHKLEVRPGKGHGWPGMESETANFLAWYEKVFAAK